MSDIIHLVPEHAQPGRGTKLPDPASWVLGERVHDSQALQAWRTEAGLVWILADLSQRQAMVKRNSALAKLRHPHLQQIAGIGLLGKWPYRADPDPAGVPLDTLYQESGPWSAERALDIALELAEILVELHSRGIVHGHIHPGALRLDGETLLLGDFPPLLGLDLAHNAPEVQLGAVADPRSDLFGLGYLTLCLLRGSRPDGAGREDSWRSGKAGPVAPLVHAAELPDTISALLRSLLDRDPARRPGSALEVAQILARARAGAARKPPSLKILGVAVLALLGVAGLSLALDRGQSSAPQTPPRAPTEPALTEAARPQALVMPTLPPTAPEQPAREGGEGELELQEGEQLAEPQVAQSKPRGQPSARAPRTERTPRASDTSNASQAASEAESEAAQEPAVASLASEGAEGLQGEDAPAVAELAPEPSSALTPEPETGPTPADWSGTWTGSANGRPMRLELQVDAEGNARGVVQQSLGAQQVRIPVRGTFAVDGRFTMVETQGGRPTTWSGQVQGSSISGSMSSKGRDRGSWSASR